MDNRVERTVKTATSRSSTAARPAHPYPHLLDPAGNIDPARVVMTAIRKARSIRACEARVIRNIDMQAPGFRNAAPFRKSTAYEIAREALSWAREEAEAAYRVTVVLPAYQASLDPAEREARQHELQIDRLRERVLWATTAWHRQYLLSQIKTLEARVEELRGAQHLEAAE